MTIINAFKQYHVDRADPTPLYFQFKNILLDMIEDMALKPGDMIPTEFDLCDIYNISRTTIRQALTELVNEGEFYRVKGRGTFVAQNKVKYDLMCTLSSFYNDMYDRGLAPSTRLLNFEVIPSTHKISKALNLTLNTDVISLKRIRFVDNEPLVISQSYLPYSSCKHLLDFNIEKESLYNLLSSSINTKVYRVEKIVEASMSTKEDCDLLNISKTIAILRVQVIGYNKFETPIEYSTLRYRGDKNVFIADQFS